MKLPSRLAGLTVLALMGGAASAQAVIAVANNPWAGFYIGANIGGAWNNTCNSWTLNGPAETDPNFVNAFNNRNCPNNGVFVGGVEIGYNFQYNQWVWGFGADYDQWSSKNHNRSYAFAGSEDETVPAGTVSFSGKVSPNGFGILGPRIGYAFDNVLPYIRVGSVFTGGSRTTTATYTATGDSTPDAYFSGSKNFKSNGFGGGVGVDYMIVDQLFFRAEYTYVNLGKGSSNATQCTASSGSATGAALCAAFNADELQLNNIHNSFTANIFRVGIAYKFE
jgi:outer membrane immunogenic protein